MASNLTCGQTLTLLLQAYGVDTVFGIPGVHTLELYKGLGLADIRHVQPRHEQGAGFMADGYARVSGRPGVCYLITGPGVTNAATPIGQAYSDSSPMLVISSVNASTDLGMGRGRLHEITDQCAVTAPLTAFSKCALSAAEVPNLIAEAFAVFRNARPRPVHISLPLDVLTAPAGFEAVARVPAPPPSPPEEIIEAACEFIRRAERPVIIAGGGTVDSGPALAAFAEASGAAVILTVAAKGVMRDDHPLCLGATLVRGPTQGVVESADLVVAVGTELSETDSWVERLPINGQLIRIDIDAASTQRDYPADVALVGDAGRALAAMTRRLDGHSPARAFANGEIAALRKKMTASQQPLQRKHIKLLDALREALPDDGVVCSDMTQIAYTGIHHFSCSMPRSWFHPSGYGTLGWALPAAIGAKLAAPERPVVALVGDAGFLFTAPEIGVAVELGLPLVVLLWNNDGLGQIRDDMIEQGIPEIGVNPRNPDYIKLADSFGAYACRPDSLEAFKTALVDAFAADGPTLIEMRQDAPFLD
jgi:thiamine pyrophosphate-dependent acetolactate synthase large subunit-like protein